MTATHIAIAALVATILLGVMEAAKWIERMLMVALAKENEDGTLL